MGTKKPEHLDVDMKHVEAALERAGKKLSEEDVELFRGLAETYITVTAMVRKSRATIAQLRRFLGFSSSEKTDDVVSKHEDEDDAPPDDPGPDASESSGSGTREVSPDGKKPKGPPRGHGRTPASAYPDACQVSVLHESLARGQRCPACGRGNLYELKPSRIVRIFGQPPLKATCWNCQRLRCNSCGAVFTAEEPAEAKGPKHSASAAAMIALKRYGYGMPFNRLAQLQQNLATPLASSTQWDVLVDWIEGPAAAFGELRRQAARGRLFHNDDTYTRILSYMGKRRRALLREGKLSSPERTGLFTTGIIAFTEEGHPVSLFFSGRKHAGENLASVLELRPEGLDPPQLMCDALSRNVPKGHPVIEDNCLSHARRGFVDEFENFPKECRYLLENLAEVFGVEAECKEDRLSEAARLKKHQSESGPVMKELRLWMHRQFDEKLVEPNSGLGKAIQYMLKRWEKLTRFLQIPGAPLENNCVERSLKMAIRQRKNSLFYRSQRGAAVGDIFMSLIHTAGLHGVNPFDYLTQLMTHLPRVVADPNRWLPWNFETTVVAT